MKFVTIEQAVKQCRADGDDNDVVTRCVNAAEAMLDRLANRAIFKTQEELTAAIAALPAEMATALSAYDAAVVAAEGATDERITEDGLEAARITLQDVKNRQMAIRRGIVIDAAIIEALFLLAAHYYLNREEVVSGQGAAAVQIPAGAESIMSHYRWIGLL